MSKTLGIICARKGSKRFPGKNLSEIGGLSLVERALGTLSAVSLDKIVLATDFAIDFDLEKYDAMHVVRSKNTSDDVIALQDTVKWVYLSLNEDYDTIVFLMPNCPMITSDSVQKTLDLFSQHNYNVVRSYNEQGQENGLIVVRTKYLMDHFIDVYCGCVVCGGDEIHDQEDYLQIKAALERSDGPVA